MRCLVKTCLCLADLTHVQPSLLAVLSWINSYLCHACLHFSAMNVVQSADIQLGLLAGSMYCAYLVAFNLQGLSAGDYVLFAT